MKRRIYLTLERGRDIALRNLLRKVFIVGGFEEAKDGSGPVRKTRITVTEFGAAISIGSKERMDNDEVECLIANMIYKVSLLVHIAFRSCLVLSSGLAARYTYHSPTNIRLPRPEPQYLGHLSPAKFLCLPLA